MKGKVISQILIPISLIAVIGSYFLYYRAETIRYQDEAEFAKQLSFRVSSTYTSEPWFMEDYLAHCLFFLGIISLITGVWLKKRNA